MLCLGLLTHRLYISCIICIMHSAFNLLVFPNSMSTPLLFFLSKGYVLSGEIALKNNIIIIIICIALFVRSWRRQLAAEI